MEEIQTNQLNEVLSYLFEPEPTDNSINGSENSDSESQSSSEDEGHQTFDVENAWRLQTLSCCKCGQCTLSTKAIECFCCHERAVEYDEYDGLLSEVEQQRHQRITTHSDFTNNMLSQSVLKVDICRYLEENCTVAHKGKTKFN
ncbi:uncharacterized protein LOC116299126 [Actinia tenebrosa]|uniref:Uncharacterized protein LOC116299126 n=1 Tax=Actinia tenebrosa TaxID=6105 RepID=A0A6P8I8Q1_ACTTE|nr:uncharacterized protein LOC116299126 [Actinia tenebrosa]